mgnify:CR=1 FL=1
MGRHGDHRYIRIMYFRPARPQSPRSLETVHHRHLQIHQHEVVRLRPQGFQRLQAVFGGIGAQSGFFENRKSHLAVDGVVFDEQDAYVLVLREKGGKNITRLSFFWKSIPASKSYQGDFPRKLRRADRFHQRASPDVLGQIVASLYTESDFPIISIDRELEGVPSVTADNFGGGVLAADALYRAGSRHVLVLTTEVPEYMAMYQRQNGFRAECASRGMECVECILNDVNFGAEETERILAQMEQHPKIDGVFALGDLIAAGFLHMLLQQPDSQRKRLPLVGFDGLDVSRLFEFSTVAQPIQKMGQLAVELLISRINGNPVPERSALPVEYIERKSTTSIRAPRASDTAR